MGRLGRTAGPLTILVSFLAGSVPFSQLAARLVAGTDLRAIGTGTVSGTALYEIAGFRPLAVAGLFDVGKGAVGPLLARSAIDGRRRRHSRSPNLLSAVAAGAAVAGHDWSPWIGRAGGRGLSPALGATVVLAPEGTLVLALGMLAGRLVRQSGLVTLLAALSLPAVLASRRGGSGLALGVCICGPMIVKRVLGNTPLPAAPGARVLSRLLFDRDPSPTRAP